jgi:hypothetical protein
MWLADTSEVAMIPRTTTRVLTFFLLCLVLLVGAPRNDAGARTRAAAGITIFLPHIARPTIIANPPATNWLAYLNQLRALGGLPAVSENATYSDGAFKHAKYMVKNDVIAHSEDSTKAYYTAEGNTAASKSNVMVSSSDSTTDNAALDMWMTGPFHGVGLIDPKLTQSGYGAYRESDGGWQMGAALDVLRGRASQIPAGTTFPIRWPANGTTSWLASYTGNESPDPLTACPGYAAPTGAPIYLQLGSGSLTPNVSSASLTRAGASLEICTYTEATYTNPDASQQSLGRSVLGSRDAVIMIPRAPLTAGSYTVSMTVSGNTYTWSFTITTTPSIAEPARIPTEQYGDLPPE